MGRYALFVRGINVGGHRRLPMADLRALLAGLGCTDVRTLLQSGNAALTSGLGQQDLAAAVEQAVAGRVGPGAEVMVVPAAELGAVVSDNPFLARGVEPAELHVALLSAVPAADRAAAVLADTAPDEGVLVDRILYLHLPQGTADSRLLRGGWERRLGVRATVRRWSTVTALLDALVS